VAAVAVPPYPSWDAQGDGDDDDDGVGRRRAHPPGAYPRRPMPP
jgi:hypothetical protein